jgi:glutaredoxin
MLRRCSVPETAQGWRRRPLRVTIAPRKRIRGPRNDPEMFGFRRKKNQPVAVVVYTRRGCGLCDEAIDLLERYGRRIPLEITKIDIEASAELTQKHGERIPVVEIDGKERFFGRIDEVLLRRILFAPDRKGS